MKVRQQQQSILLRTMKSVTWINTTTKQQTKQSTKNKNIICVRLKKVEEKGKKRGVRLKSHKGIVENAIGTWVGRGSRQSAEHNTAT